jgi:hypothetical protein
MGNVDALHVCGASDHANILKDVDRVQGSMIENSEMRRGFWGKGCQCGFNIRQGLCDSCQLSVYFGLFTFRLWQSRPRRTAKINADPSPFLRRPLPRSSCENHLPWRYAKFFVPSKMDSLNHSEISLPYCKLSLTNAVMQKVMV